jgi:hypothetical protein
MIRRIRNPKFDIIIREFRSLSINERRHLLLELDDLKGVTDDLMLLPKDAIIEGLRREKSELSQKVGELESYIYELDHGVVSKLRSRITKLETDLEKYKKDVIQTPMYQNLLRRNTELSKELNRVRESSRRISEELAVERLNNSKHTQN